MEEIIVKTECDNCKASHPVFNMERDCCLIRYLAKTPEKARAGIYLWLAGTRDDVEELKLKVEEYKNATQIRNSTAQSSESRDGSGNAQDNGSEEQSTIGEDA